MDRRRGQTTIALGQDSAKKLGALHLWAISG
jgi:hypothetical protein